MALFRPPVTRPLHPNSWVRPRGSLDFRVTSPFGPRDLNGDGKIDDFHGALDIGNGRLGDDVVAARDGNVIAAGYLKEPWSESTTLYPTGNFGGLMVVIGHPGGMVSIYAHLANRSVGVGERVVAGQRIGAIGDSGSAQGQGHVHFGIQASKAIPGVAAHKTLYGIGLDVDPWPLITDMIPDTALPLEEDDVQTYGGAELRPLGAPFTLEIASHFRAASTRQSDSLAIFAAKTVVYPSVAVTGEKIGDNDQWAPCYMYVDGRYRWGFFHTSLLVPPAIDCAAEKATIAQQAEQIAVTKTQLAEAKSKINAAKAALA